uniref:Uncharacterized protein n=1 Tax=Clytia hemisphaerica TaxID=252671 RepID=A0A7M5XJL2_9CNID
EESDDNQNDPDAALELAIARIDVLCAPFESSPRHSPLALSPIHERTIINDSAIGLGSSFGEVVDTEDELDNPLVNDDSGRSLEELASVGNEDVENNNDQGIPQMKVIEDEPNEVVIQKEKRPDRPCPFGCKKPQSVLTRHLKLIHKNEPAVKNAMSKPQGPKRNKAFDLSKKEGIFQHNQKEMAKESPEYMRERKPKLNSNQNSIDKLVVCAKCKGTYSKGFKARHQIECGKTDGQVMIPMIPASDLKIVTEYPNSFMEVINKMNIDDVSDLAKTDPLILVVGARIYNGNKSKSEKLNEVEKRVRSTMRLLSRILLKFRQSYGEKKDLSVVFHMTNLKHLRFAIEELTESEEAIKSGLKVQIQNVIKQSAKVLEAHFLIEGKSQEATDVCDFVKVFHLVEDEIFNGALYAIKQKRNKTTRKPANLPDEDLVQELKAYILKVTLKSNFIFQSPKDVFVDVRDAACARLTMFNGRRGGEPARLYVYQWTEALKGDWIRPKLREDYIASVKTKNRITYQEGKGLKQVCVFFPPDYVDSLIFLCDPDVRREVDTPKTNTFVFPSTQQSKNHVEGWHALTNSCKKGGITSKINGTMNRHRVS